MREFNIKICDACYGLEDGMCHEPECACIRMTKSEVSELLNILLIRPIIDGEQIDLYPLGTPQEKKDK